MVLTVYYVLDKVRSSTSLTAKQLWPKGKKTFEKEYFILKSMRHLTYFHMFIGTATGYNTLRLVTNLKICN